MTLPSPSTSITRAWFQLPSERSASTESPISKREPGTYSCRTSKIEVFLWDAHTRADQDYDQLATEWRH